MKARIRNKICKATKIYESLLYRALKGDQLTRKERHTSLRYNSYQIYRAKVKEE